MEIILRTKTPANYFRGEIKKGTCLDGERWYIACKNYYGGGGYLLKITDWQCKTKKKLLTRIRKFKKRHNLTSKP